MNRIKSSLVSEHHFARSVPQNIDATHSLGNDARVSPQPFANLHRRTPWLRGTLLAATFLGLIASAPVWTNSHAFPLLPIFNGFPILQNPWDQCHYVLMLGSLVAAMWCYRPAVIAFLVASFLAYCGDQNRGQPWLYMYWVMLLLSLFPAPVALAANRVALVIVYLWGGVQKLNARFFAVTPEWFVAPANNWHLPPTAIDLLKLSVKAAPFIEIAIATLLWFPRLRRAALIMIVLTHTFALFFLGPLGHNYNWVVWPWNLAMITLAFGLFALGNLFETPLLPTPPRQKLDASDLAKQTVSELRQSPACSLVLALYGLLPLLSYSGRWDSYFSFSLYSENLAVANIFVTESFRERLPASLRKYAQPFPQAFDPTHQGPLTFSFTTWGFEETHVPPISEPRNFMNVYRALRPYTQKPEDLRMIIGPRSGPVIFCEGDRIEFLQRAK